MVKYMKNHVVVVCIKVMITHIHVIISLILHNYMSLLMKGMIRHFIVGILWSMFSTFCNTIGDDVTDMSS